MNLKPCPFCVGDGEVNLDGPHVVCSRCGCTGPSVSDEVVERAESDDEIEATAARLWNARVQS